jgi:hypothetical protein
MLRLQHTLPRLPVPPLQQTMDQYLHLLKPLVSEEVFNESQRAVAEFLASPVSDKLHRYVVAMSQDPAVENWLDRWWSDSYLTDRSSPGVFVSPTIFLEPNPDPAVQQDFVRRAAVLTHHTVTYHEKIRQLDIEPGTFKGKPFCMEDYQNFFNSVRLPALGRDIVVRHKQAKHIVVMSKGRLFRLPVFDAKGAPQSIAALTTALKEIVAFTAAEVPSQTETSRIGALTALHRDQWAAARGKLLTKSLRNTLNLSIVEEAMFVLNLDGESEPSLYGSATGIKCLLGGDHTTSGGQTCVSESGANGIPYLNRWFDKSFQVHVTRNGTSAGTFEHSAMDSLPVLYWTRHVHEAEAGDYKHGGQEASTAATDLSLHQPPQELVFDVDSDILGSVENGLATARRTLSRLDAEAIKVIEFGGKFLSKELSVSPDAFVQMALQLTFFNIRGHTPSTYESAATKTFLRGRTETLRMPTVSSQQAVNQLRQLPPTPSTEAAASCGAQVRKALAAHGETAKKCLEGQGCDRHLFGMICAAQEMKMPMPRAFTCQGFKTWSKILLSTTHPLALPGVAGVCFGPVNDDCIGCGYEVFPNYVVLSTTSWRQGESKRFNDALRQAMTTLVGVLKASLPAKSKL